MESLWKEIKEARRLDDVGALLLASQLVGQNSKLVLWGGGNSSVKTEVRDYRGRALRALFVKGSGSDMRTLTASNLASLDLDALLELRQRERMSDEEMVDYLAHSLLNPKSPRPSIETLLHAFLPAKFVLHTHADATAALVDNPFAAQHVKACYAGRVGLVPYQRPGFSLSLQTWRSFQANPHWEGILLDKHGLISWGPSAKQAYESMIKLVSQAERYLSKKARFAKVKAGSKAAIAAQSILPALRGALSAQARQILCFDGSAEAQAFSLRPDIEKLAQAGPATPDHLLYTGPRALVCRLKGKGDDAKAVQGQVLAYRRWYESYFKKYSKPGLIRQDSAPRIIILPGLGLVSTGRDAKSALIGRDIFRHSLWVRQAAQGLGGYKPISTQETCDFEYWPLENAKLAQAGPQKEFARQIALVTGAGRGIGRACALALAKAGACVAVLDLDGQAAAKVTAEVERLAGLGSGLALQADIGDENAVAKAFEALVLRWGGLDLLVSNAGLARCAPVAGMTTQDWDASFRVNARGHFLCSREAAKIFMQQGLGGSMVFISSKNVTAPGKDFAAYSASKAAQTQLAKVLALELAPHGVRVNCVLPDGVFEDSRLWEGIRESRAKAHGIAPDALEAFYVQRNLLKKPVRPADVAEAVLFLAGVRSACTTGSLLPVDGGVKEAFPR